MKGSPASAVPGEPASGKSASAGARGLSAADCALIDEALRGSQRAWDRLVERYGRLVYSIPRRYRMSAADADDVFQAVFLSLYRNLGRLREGQRLSAWLITTAHRECWRVARRATASGELDPGHPADTEPTPEQILRWERQDLVRAALTRLGGPCGRLLEMLFIDPDRPSYQDIARALGMREGSIGPTRARCLSKLEAILRSMGLDELE